MSINLHIYLYLDVFIILINQENIKYKGEISYKFI